MPAHCFPTHGRLLSVSPIHSQFVQPYASRKSRKGTVPCTSTAWDHHLPATPTLASSTTKPAWSHRKSPFTPFILHAKSLARNLTLHVQRPQENFHVRQSAPQQSPHASLCSVMSPAWPHPTTIAGLQTSINEPSSCHGWSTPVPASYQKRRNPLAWRL